MGNFINGYSYPRIIVKQTDNVYITEFDLPLCMMSGGFEQSYSEDFSRHEMADGTIIDFGFQGAKLSFNLDYSSLLKKPSYYIIEEIIKFHRLPEEYKIILIPRIDVLPQQFEVRFADNKILDLGLHRNGADAIGNRLTSLRFVTKDNYSGQLFFDPDDLNRPLPFNLK